MKIKLSVLILFLFAQVALAQEQEKFNRQEVGLSFSNFTFDNVGLNYRIGSETGLWRIGLGTTLIGSTSDQTMDSAYASDSYNVNNLILTLGREKRIEVAEDLKIRIGTEIGYGRSKVKGFSEFEFRNALSIRETTTTSNTYGIGLVLGTIYQLNKNIFIGFEFLPKYTYSLSKTTSIIEDDRNTNDFKTENNSSNSKLDFNFNSTTFLFNVGFNF
ncbi:MAG: hypothetical protein ACI9L9_000816 [Marivirga sp.]|jgi:hypothetical protein